MTVEQIQSDILREFPRVRFVSKSNVWWCRLIGRFAPAFMSRFATTIGNTIYLPTGGAGSATLRHERVHLRQQRRYGFLPYALLYLFFPLPVAFAWGRWRLEREAYLESLKAYSEDWGADWHIVRATNIAYIVDVLSSGAYLWSWLFKKSMVRWFDSRAV